MVPWMLVLLLRALADNGFWNCWLQILIGVSNGELKFEKQLMLPLEKIGALKILLANINCCCGLGVWARMLQACRIIIFWFSNELIENNRLFSWEGRGNVRLLHEDWLLLKIERFGGGVMLVLLVLWWCCDGWLQLQNYWLPFEKCFKPIWQLQVMHWHSPYWSLDIVADNERECL